MGETGFCKNIEKVEQFGVEKLIENLRNVVMLTDNTVFPYKDSCVSLEKISVGCLAPPQTYILNSQLKTMRELKWKLEEKGINLLELNGFIRMYLSDGEEPMDLLPPVVEETIQDDGTIVPVVADGMHRVYLSYLEWKIPQVIYIRGLSGKLPYYAYPLPRNKSWESVDQLDDISDKSYTIPKGYIKKWHIIANYKSLYRDFTTGGFCNVGKPRGRNIKRESGPGG